MSFLKKYKKKVIIGVLASLVLIGAFLLFNKKETGLAISPNEVTILSKKEFVHFVNENGKAVSETSRNIYAEKLFPIKDINIEVGDKVKAGDVIATLDDSQIKQQIEQKNAMIKASNSSVGPQIKNAKDRLREAQRNLQNGTNAQIVSAENAVDTAYKTWQNAEIAYGQTVNARLGGYSADKVGELSTETSLEIAKDSSLLNYDQAVQNYNELKYTIENSSHLAYLTEMKLEELKNEDARNKEKQIAIEQENLQVAKPDENNSESAESLANNSNKLIELQVKSAEIKQQIAEVSAENQKYKAEVEAAEKSISASEKQLEQAGFQIYSADKNIDTANLQKDINAKNKEINEENLKKQADDLKAQYEAAKKNLELAKLMARDEINALKNSLNMGSAGVDNSLNYVDLKFLNEDLDKTKILSPIDGTITEMTMIKGQTPQNYVAKIETVERLVIESQIKEFDVNFVSVGMEVEITSDASGNNEIVKGRVESIDPTPLVSTVATNEVSYGVKISLDQEEESIKPGMNVRVKYILDRKNNVFTIPTSAIYEKNEKYFLLVLDKNTSTIKEIPVEINGENNFESVISGDLMKNNMIIINSPDLYSAGMEVHLDNTDQSDTPLQEESETTDNTEEKKGE